ncbi:hypothetical protein HCN44_006276 [Aphidius gifuensis]|uniref:Complex I assembly factor TIMMDC1, mitochondrial n=1 Tax=Aphidius gifuensis TaxID=684658 RepID=A0A834XW78_APHGI|nr:RPII140-upstream gene protein [Aphidius gifuensis]KAF7993216.1 hypothetical protein HCN44_006276 [Aphidius gifuensis]
MVSLLRNVPFGRLSVFGLFTTSSDEVKTPGYEDLIPEKPTGWAGIRSLFTFNEYGELRPELATATQMSTLCILGGMMFGGFLHARVAWIDFMENNHATMFANHIDAKKKLQDVVTFNMGKGAVKWGTKIGGFCTLCIFTNQFIAAYRGKPGIIEYIGAGALSGGLYKLNMGVRGLAVGTIVGAACGTVAGATSIALLKLTGYTMEDIQQTQYEIKNLRDERVRAAHKNMLKEEVQTLRSESVDLRESRKKDGSLDNIDTVNKK